MFDQHAVSMWSDGHRRTERLRPRSMLYNSPSSVLDRAVALTPSLVPPAVRYHNPPLNPPHRTVAARRKVNGCGTKSREGAREGRRKPKTVSIFLPFLLPSSVFGELMCESGLLSLSFWSGTGRQGGGRRSGRRAGGARGQAVGVTVLAREADIIHLSI